MTEFVKKTGKGVAATVIAIACAFGGGVVGASFQAGVEHQDVDNLKTWRVDAQMKMDQLGRDDSDQKERIASLESLVTNFSEAVKQQGQLAGDIAEIRGQLGVLLRNLPVSTLKMQPRPAVKPPARGR